MADILPPAPVDAPFGSYNWADWYKKVRDAINSATTIAWSAVTGTPTTIAGYGITDAQREIQFKDEGVNLGAAGDVTSIDFTGTGVAATILGNALTVNITSGGGSGTVTSVGITPPSAGITVSGSPVTTSGNMTLALADDLAAIENIASTGIICRTASNTWTSRTLTAASSKISLTNADGVSGNPSIDINESDLTLTNIGGTLSIAKGGTGQTTASSAFDALSPLTTQGDIIYRNATTNTRLAAGTAGYVLVTGGAGADPSWKKLSVENASTAQQGAGFASDTYLTGSYVVIPSGQLKAGTYYRCVFDVSKTAAGTAAPVITVRVGTAGTTADTARCTLTFSAQTAVADSGMFEVLVNVRATGATAVLQAAGRLTHRLTVTGLANTASNTVLNTSGSFDITPANTGIGISVNGGASASWTVQLVQAELRNFA